MIPGEVAPMTSHASERMANITATLTIPLLEIIDELVHEGKVPSRSHVIREAVRNYLKTFE
jgi:Arc/MetJ-type ribon-helix-helix transcriptional regulator